MADEDVPFGLNAPHEISEDDHTVISSASGPDGMNPLGITTMPPPAPPPGSTPNPPFNASRYQPSSSKPSPAMDDMPPPQTSPTNGHQESYAIPSDNVVGQITNGTNSEEINEDSSDGGKRSKKPSGLGMKWVLGIAFLVVAAGAAAVGIVLGQKDDGGNGNGSQGNPIGTGGNPPPSPASIGTPSSPTLAPFSAPPAIPARTTLGDILNRGFLRCGVSPDTKGFSVYDEKTRRHEGFDADLVRDSISFPIMIPSSLVLK